MVPEYQTNSAVRVLFIGQSLPASVIENMLSRHDASSYHCAANIEAAEWLIDAGFRADVIIAHRAAFNSVIDLDQWRPWVGCRVVTVNAPASDRDFAEIDFALGCATRAASMPASAIQRPRSSNDGLGPAHGQVAA